jgi:hypothetical protein
MVTDDSGISSIEVAAAHAVGAVYATSHDKLGDTHKLLRSSTTGSSGALVEDDASG